MSIIPLVLPHKTGVHIIRVSALVFVSMIILIIDGPRGQTTAQSVDPTGLSAAIICDVPVSDSIDTILDKDFHSFSVTGGEIVSITVEEVPSGQDFSPFWRLIDKIGQSAVSCGSSSTVDHRDCGPLPANGSPYSIEIQDYNNDNTGTYKVHIQRLTSSAACEGTVLSCDTPAPGNIEDDFDTDLYNFSATEGEIVSIIVDKDPDSQDLAINWRLLDTTGAPAPSCGSDTSSDHRDCGPLPASGSPYTIEVHDYGHNDTGTYQLHIQRLTSSAACEGTALNCDTPAADNIEDEFDTDLFNFNVTEGEIVSIIIDKDPDYQDITTYWRMLDSAGEPAVSCGTSSSSDHRDCGPLPASGNPFTIEVQDYSNDNTGTYKLHLQRLTYSTACEGTTLSCDTPAADNIEDAFDTDLFNFNVTEGEIVSIIIDKDPDYQDITTYWRMLNWAGEPAVSCGTSSSSDHRDCGPLPASGNPFTIEVQDYGNDNSGTYKLHIQRLTYSAACEGTTLSCDTPAADNIEDEFDTDLFNFNVTEGEIVSIIIDKDPDYQDITTYWRLLDSAGEPAVSCGTSSSSDHRDCGPLPASGNPFTIEVQDYSNDNTGTYKLHLQRLTYSAACEGTALSCDTPAADNIEDAFDTDLFNFNVTEGEIVSIIIDKDPDYQDITTYWRLLNWAGEPAVSCGTSSSSDHRDCGPLPASGNPYTIEVQDYSYDNTGTYKLHLQRLTASAACDRPTLNCHTPVFGVLDDEMDTDLYGINVLGGETLSISVVEFPSSQDLSTYWRLLDSSGEPESSCGSASTSELRDCGPLFASDSPYTLEIMDYGYDDTGTYIVSHNGCLLYVPLILR